MLRMDLEAAGIPYEDASGLVFDFHALRCEMATLADQAGISPRVVQRLMRHSTLELTGRYTRPRAVDIENAASMLPSLKPSGDRPESVAATGTDGRLSQRQPSEAIGQPAVDAGNSSPERQSISERLSHYFPTGEPGNCRKPSDVGVMTGSDAQSSMSSNPLVEKGVAANRRVLSAAGGSTGVRTRTGDLRIMRPPL
jgi:hypothetical protein